MLNNEILNIDWYKFNNENDDISYILNENNEFSFES